MQMVDHFDPRHKKGLTPIPTKFRLHVGFVPASLTGLLFVKYSVVSSHMPS